MRQPRPPTKITLDGYAASHRAVADLEKTGEWPKRVGVRSNKYLNHTIEPDHRGVKQRLATMRGVSERQRWSSAASSWRKRSSKGSSRSASFAEPRQPCRKSGGPAWLRKQTTPDRRGKHDRLPSQSEICTRTRSTWFLRNGRPPRLSICSPQLLARVEYSIYVQGLEKA